MPLHGVAGGTHHGQNARIGHHDDAAREGVAEDEKCHREGACIVVLIGEAPVDATGRTIRLGAVLAPVDQGGTGKQQGICPSAGNKQAAVERTEAVSLGTEI